jgi:prepilin-type N-terminal cleavage/methylation domain-containing protein
MSPRKNSVRGYTLAEVLTAIMILGILGSFVTVIVAPLLNAPNVQQAKIDTTQSGAATLYRLQRDVRQGQVNGVYVCTYPAPTTCSVPSTAPTFASVQVVAILTARASGSGYAAWSSTGQPSWQGFQVYWLVDDGRGHGTYNLEYAFSASSGAQPGAATSSANTAVNSALQSASPERVAGNFLSVQIDQDVVSKMVGLKISSQSTVDSKTNESTFEGDSFARN